MNRSIYLDGFATLPLAPEAAAAMTEAWSVPGNAAAPHFGGERAAAIIAVARSEIAELIAAAPSEIIFTSGATEANNIALIGGARSATRHAPRRKRIIVSAVEHKAVLEPAERLRAEGFDVVRAPVDQFGRLDVDSFACLLDESALLVSIMAVNNETGVIQPIAEVAALARAVGALVHCDAAQAAGKIPIDVIALDVDYLSLSAHKMYGPMGVGALYIAATAPKPEPLMCGGGQQGGLRPGTEPVPLIAGFGEAARLARATLEEDRRRGQEMSDLLLSELAAHQLRPVRVSGDKPVVPGSLTLSLTGVDAEQLCVRLARTVQMSTGSACTSGQLRISHVLEAMGFSEWNAQSVARIFCNRYTRDDEIRAAAEHIATAARQSRLVAG